MILEAPSTIASLGKRGHGWKKFMTPSSKVKLARKSQVLETEIWNDLVVSLCSSNEASQLFSISGCSRRPWRALLILPFSDVNHKSRVRGKNSIRHDPNMDGLLLCYWIPRPSLQFCGIRTPIFILPYTKINLQIKWQSHSYEVLLRNNCSILHSFFVTIRFVLRREIGFTWKDLEMKKI